MYFFYSGLTWHFWLVFVGVCYLFLVLFCLVPGKSTKAWLHYFASACKCKMYMKILFLYCIYLCTIMPLRMYIQFVNFENGDNVEINVDLIWFILLIILFARHESPLEMMFLNGSSLNPPKIRPGLLNADGGKTSVGVWESILVFPAKCVDLFCWKSKTRI